MHSKTTRQQVLKLLKENLPVSIIKERTGVPDRTIREWRQNSVIEPVKTYVFTCAQVGTSVHELFMDNLIRFCEEKDALLQISGFTYNTGKQGRNHGDAELKDYTHNYDQRVRPWMNNEDYEINSKIRWLGNMNTLPTAVNPLSGLQTYTGCQSAVVPHTKVQMECVATRAGRMAKQLWTTGTCTIPNYIKKKAGIKGEFHHSLGAVIVEIADDKIFHIRRIIGDDVDGSFYDLTSFYANGEVSKGHRVDSITYGDIHREKLNEKVAEATWFGKDCMLDTLKPKHQFFHDLSDFSPRNHHNIGSHDFRIRTAEQTVEGALRNCSYFLNETARDFCNSVVVESNHDQAFLKWLKEADIVMETNIYNVKFYHECKAKIYDAVLKDDRDFNIFEKVLRRYMNINSNLWTRFLKVDESYVVNGVEGGFHGHLGINGSRGSLKQFAKVGPKSTSGHTHSPGCFEGAWCAGVSADYDMGYNKGPSSWWQTHVVQYPSGHRTHINIVAGQWKRDSVVPAKISKPQRSM